MMNDESTYKLHCKTVEDEAKAKLLISWFETLSLKELDEMRNQLDFAQKMEEVFQVFSGNKKTDNEEINTYVAWLQNSFAT